MNPTEEWLTQPEGLATRMRAMRERADLSGKELAETLGWAQSKVSRLENGRQIPSAADVDAWARACGADRKTAQELMRLLEEVQTAHQDWKHRMRHGQAAVQAEYNELVKRTSVVRHFETIWVPGLLQTADYARRVFQEMSELHGARDVDEAVAARMQRQQWVYDRSKQFEFLLFQPVLRAPLPGAEVMRGQLDRLQTVIGLPNVRFGILPLDVPLSTTPQNSFQMYDDAVVMETFSGETQAKPAEAELYAAVMKRLWQEAVVGEDARRLIVAAASQLSTT